MVLNSKPLSMFAPTGLMRSWNATPEEQRVKFVNIARHVMNAAGYQTQVVDNPDEQNRRIALEKLIGHAVNRKRRCELDLYKRYPSDDDFKRAFEPSIMRISKILKSFKSCLQLGKKRAHSAPPHKGGGAREGENVIFQYRLTIKLKNQVSSFLGQSQFRCRSLQHLQ